MATVHIVGTVSKPMRLKTVEGDGGNYFDLLEFSVIYGVRLKNDSNYTKSEAKICVSGAKTKDIATRLHVGDLVELGGSPSYQINKAGEWMPQISCTEVVKLGVTMAISGQSQVHDCDFIVAGEVFQINHTKKMTFIKVWGYDDPRRVGKKQPRKLHDIWFFHSQLKPPEGIEKGMLIKAWGDFSIKSREGTGKYEGHKFRNIVCTARACRIIGTYEKPKTKEITVEDLPF